MININDHLLSTDSESFENALRHLQPDGILLVPPRRSDIEPERSYWLIDRAILLAEGTTVIMQNSTIKLSDKCRDNFFRSANCGLGIEFPQRIKNIHIIGRGRCTLVGAEHPRATGDGGKQLAASCLYPSDTHMNGCSFGTDAGTAESQYGDWRGIGILLANVEGFSIDGLRIVDSHGWAISLEECAHGRIEHIDFDSRMLKTIDGECHCIKNQDGIDLRNGCHDILISNITGQTGDDVIALTAIADERRYGYHPGGSLRTTHVMHSDWKKRERDIYDITIRNVTAYSELCATIRLLPCSAYIRNVLIDGVIDSTSDGDSTHSTTILLGDGGNYGENLPDSMRDIIISNVLCNSDNGVLVGGFLCDSIISNVINRKKNAEALTVRRENGLKNVSVNAVLQSVLN